jgi:hypothetical protein
MSLRDDRDFEQAIHSSELQAENDRLRSQLEGCEERLREAEEALVEAGEALRNHATHWITISPLLEEPYPDDPRWSPWTRFGKRACDRGQAARKQVREALTALREGRETQTP